MRADHVKVGRGFSFRIQSVRTVKVGDQDVCTACACYVEFTVCTRMRITLILRACGNRMLALDLRGMEWLKPPQLSATEATCRGTQRVVQNKLWNKGCWDMPNFALRLVQAHGLEMNVYIDSDQLCTLCFVNLFRCGRVH